MLLAIGTLFLFPITKEIHDPAMKRKYYVIQAITLLAALAGTKLAVLVGDLNWPMQSVEWSMVWQSGRSIMGALLLGFIVAEIIKPVFHYMLPPTDRFATVLPFSLALGRIGCLINGCCLGIPYEGWCSITYADGISRHPTQLYEMAFNLSVGLLFIWMLRRNLCRGQFFSLYLVLYGAFRLGNEFLRDTPRFSEPFSAYQYMALGMVALGTLAILLRLRYLRVR